MPSLGCRPNPSSNAAEIAFLVYAAWRGCELGAAMQRLLADHACACGLRRFTSEILPKNARTLALAKAGDGDIVIVRDDDTVSVTTLPYTWRAPLNMAVGQHVDSHVV